MQNDAKLADVTFVDAPHGWAVGDRGVIWHTDDGGATGRCSARASTRRLASRSAFSMSRIGWAAGGFTQPYTGSTSGVVLRTRDGGQRWTVERKS